MVKRVKTVIVVPKNWLRSLWKFSEGATGNDFSVQALRLYINIVFFKDPLRNRSRSLEIDENSLKRIMKISKIDRLHKVLNEVGFFRKNKNTWEYSLKNNETYTLGKNTLNTETWEVITLDKVWRSIEAQKEILTYKLFFYLLFVGTYMNKKFNNSTKPVHVIGLDKLFYKLNIGIGDGRKDLKYRNKVKVLDTLDFFKDLGFIYEYELKGNNLLIVSKILSEEEENKYLSPFKNIGFSLEAIKKRET